MNTKEILAYLRKALDDVPRLRQLHYDNQDCRLWQYGIEDVLKVNFGEDSAQFKRFRVVTSWPLSGPESRYREAYVRNLTSRETALRAIIQTLELLGGGDGAEKARPSETERPAVFIAHGGESSVLTKLEEYVIALGCEPIIAEKQPSADRSVNEQVEWCLDRSDCAIVLATAESLQEGKLYSRPNVYIELGRFQERYPGKTIYLLEEGARFPSNISEKVWERFTQDNMERAFLKVARELRAFGFLYAGKTN